MSIVGSEQWMYSSGREFYDFPIERSLRFEDGDTAYLSRTPATAGNRKTWTWSGWVKRGNLGLQRLFTAGTSGSSYIQIRFDTNDEILCSSEQPSTVLYLQTSQTFRDPSAWYHIVIAMDTTQSTAADRTKLYINGSLVTDFSSSTRPSQNTDLLINSTTAHMIGALSYGTTSGPYDGYMAEVNFIDGTALDASSFGETKSGIWVPKDPTGLTYGTNGFRLNFGDTVTANGFNAVTYTGNGGTQSINGVGFEPDMVWLKSRSAAYDHVITDSVRGAEKQIITNKTDAESQDSGKGLTSFDSDGFTVTLGTSTSYNNSSQTYVGWAWDAGTGSAASNTDGSISSTLKANTDYGFSIVSYTGTGANATVGHGLGVAPSMLLVKDRSATNNWQVFTETTGNTAALFLNLTASVDSGETTYWNNTSPTSSVFSIGTNTKVNTSGRNYIAYCFAEKTGYSKFGSFTGTGAAGNSITLGFEPAFVMWKSSTANTNWTIADNTRDTSNPITARLIPNLSNAEDTAISVDFNATGFEFNSGAANDSGQTFIYMAFADTRDAAFWRDTSGQGNNWQPNNLTFSDVVPDGTNNFAVIRTMNDPEESGVARAEGNLKYTTGSGTSARNTNKIGISNILPSTGKWYAEVRIHNTVTSFVGVGTLQGMISPTSNNTRYAYIYATDGNSYVRTGASESISTHGAAISVGDVVGIYVDMDASTPELYFSKNGQWSNGSGSFNQSTPTSAITLGDTFFTADTSNENQLAFHCCSASSGTSAQFIWNFGQDSTFAGNEAAGGNADANGIGDFYSTVPDDALALCTSNLPSGAIDTLNDETPEDYFNTVLYTGDGNTGRTVTGVGFQPDFAWIKERSSTSSHILSNAIAGSTKLLSSNTTDAEATDSNKITSFDSDGYTLGSSGAVNQSSQTYVGWNWKANGAGVSNTDGSITSTVSVGATSQQNWFSISKYTGTGSSMTWGHGLGVKPDLFIVKKTNSADEWIVYPLGATGNLTQFLKLHSTAGFSSDSVLETANSSVLGFGSSGARNGSGDDYICYAFANAEGLCKVGSYRGNGSSDGPFVFTGFRPAFILTKRYDGVVSWPIWDNRRDGYNATNKYLLPNLSNAESSASSTSVDFLSNGFKFRGGSAIGNLSGGNYIYLAIAEQPFAFANAR